MASAEHSAEAHLDLGQARWLGNDLAASMDHRRRAYELYRNAGDPAAARVACWIALEEVARSGDLAPAREWLDRAAAAVDGQEPSPGFGWLLLTRATLGGSPIERVAEAASDALALARTLPDRDLEGAALALLGRSVVASGRVGEGLALLDQAMVAVTAGHLHDVTVIADTFCLAAETAELAGDLRRASAWIGAAAAWYGGKACGFIAGQCRTTCASVLVAHGRWAEAEAQLLAAIGLYEAGHQGLTGHARARLAELRLRRGALAGAAEVLDRLGSRPESVFPNALARLRLGETGAALTLAEALLPAGPLTLRDLPALSVAIDALLAGAGSDRAAGWVAKLSALAESPSASSWLQAEAKLAEGRVAAASGDQEEAASTLSEAARLAPNPGSPLTARIQLALGEVLEPVDPAGATVRGQTALALFRRLGLPWESGQAAGLLRRLGRPAGPAGAPPEPSRPPGTVAPADPAVLSDLPATLVGLRLEGLSLEGLRPE